MYHQIITHNTFLKVALHELFREFNGNSSYYIIDLDNSADLNEILQHTMQSSYLNCKLFLCGSKGVYSELFSAFDVISLDDPLVEIREQIRHDQTINQKDIEEFIQSVRKLESLTYCQRKICLLDRMHRLATAPTILNLNTSSIYRNIWLAARKLNFNTLLNFRVFIKNEYSNEELNLLWEEKTVQRLG